MISLVNITFLDYTLVISYISLCLGLFAECIHRSVLHSFSPETIRPTNGSFHEIKSGNQNPN